MPVATYNKDSKESLSEHFNVSEFKCPCDSCSETLVSSSLIQLLEKVRSLLGTEIRINSGYRCPEYQSELKSRGYETATGISQHTLGCAADITCLPEDTKTGKDIETASRQAGFKAVGLGHSWCHVDTRMDKERSWTYVKR